MFLDPLELLHVVEASLLDHAPREPALDARQLDTFAELINIGVGRAARTLNQMLDTFVELQSPRVQVVRAEELFRTVHEHIQGEVSCVKMPFSGVLNGHVSLLFPPDDAARICDSMARRESESTDMDALRIGTLKEIGNVLLNAVMAVVAEGLNDYLRFTVPDYRENTLDEIFRTDAMSVGGYGIVAHISFALCELKVDGNLLLYLDVDSLDPLTVALNRLRR